MRMSRTSNKILYPYDFLTILGYLVEIVRGQTYSEHRRQSKRAPWFYLWILYGFPAIHSQYVENSVQFVDYTSLGTCLRRMASLLIHVRSNYRKNSTQIPAICITCAVGRPIQSRVRGYDPVLGTLNTIQLQDRRTMATTTILFLFKIINNRTDSVLLLRFINFNDRSRLYAILRSFGLIFKRL